MPQPIVFISYAWQDEDHQAWILRLASDLQGNGVEVIIDRWDLRPGGDVAAFMDQGIARAQHVLLVCTDAFAERADGRRGGVGYEHTIVTGELLTDPAFRDRLVPLLRQGSPATALPRYLRTRLFIDFRDDASYPRALEQLLRHLHGAYEHVRPAPSVPGTPLDSAAPGGVRSELPLEPARWVLVAGTGPARGFTERLRETAARLGKRLAGAGYGLVTGGWPGVDDAVARAFATTLAASGRPLENFLRQVIAEGSLPAFPAGDLFLVRPGREEWTEAIDRADAVVLVGGIGGTWKTGVLALESGRPVLPLADTGGDAAKLYLRMTKDWDGATMAGLTKAQFQRVARQAPEVADEVPELLAILWPRG